MYEGRIVHIEGKLAEETVVSECQNCGEGQVERHVIYSNKQAVSHTYMCSECGYEKYYPDKRHYLAAKVIVQQFTKSKQQVYDGSTEEGYLYTLCGTEDKIKRLFKSKTLEVYMYDFWRPCQLCDSRNKKDLKPEGAEDRIYVFIKGLVAAKDKSKPDPDAFCWTNTHIYCPKCWTELNDMFVGLESNDP